MKIQRLIIVLIISSFISCANFSKKDIFGVYTTDKVPFELSDEKEFHYLIIEDNYYELKYNDISKKGVTDTWSFLSMKNDTIYILFNYNNRKIIGNFTNNSIVFESPNIFDNRFNIWIYIKTNIDRKDMWQLRANEP